MISGRGHTQDNLGTGQEKVVRDKNKISKIDKFMFLSSAEIRQLIWLLSLERDSQLLLLILIITEH